MKSESDEKSSTGSSRIKRSMKERKLARIKIKEKEEEEKKWENQLRGPPGLTSEAGLTAPSPGMTMTGPSPFQPFRNNITSSYSFQGGYHNHPLTPQPNPHPNNRDGQEYRNKSPWSIKTYNFQQGISMKHPNYYPPGYPEPSPMSQIQYPMQRGAYDPRLQGPLSCKKPQIHSSSTLGTGTFSPIVAYNSRYQQFTPGGNNGGGNLRMGEEGVVNRGFFNYDATSLSSSERG